MVLLTFFKTSGVTVHFENNALISQDIYQLITQYFLKKPFQIASFTQCCIDIKILNIKSMQINLKYILHVKSKNLL